MAKNKKQVSKMEEEILAMGDDFSISLNDDNAGLIEVMLEASLRETTSALTLTELALKHMTSTSKPLTPEAIFDIYKGALETIQEDTLLQQIAEQMAG